MMDWRERVRLLIGAAKEHLEQSVRTTNVQVQRRHQAQAIYILMEAVEVHNDFYYHKVDDDGTEVPETD